MSPRLSTRQLLEKIPNYPCLYWHTVNKEYYGIKVTCGKRKEHNLKTADRKIAERRLDKWIGELAELDHEAEKLILKELLEKFLLALKGKAAKTQATTQSIVKRFKDTWSHGLDIRVSQIRPSHLNEWLALHEGRLKHTTYNAYTAFLKQLFLIAVRDRIIVKSPFDGVTTKWKKPQKPHRHVPTEAQFNAIVANIRSQKYHDEAEGSADFIEFLGLAGLGQAEASSLTWGDIDWEKNRLHVKRHKTHARFYVPIYDHLQPLLKRLRKQRPSPEQYVFKIKDGKKALAKACERLRFPNFSQRNLRQALIGRLWKAGIDKKLIAKWQGHQDGGKLIMDTYTEVFGDNDAAYEVEQLAKLKV